MNENGYKFKAEKFALLAGLIFSIFIIFSYFISSLDDINFPVATSPVFTKTVVKSDVACAPCQEEPVREQCKMTSFAYEALVDKFSIEGYQELKRGDVYVLQTSFYDNDWDDFCTKEVEVDGQPQRSCYGAELILNKKLFKPIK